MTLEELRDQFEKEYKLLGFCTKRDRLGQYHHQSTYQAWGGYKVCAKLNGLLDENIDIYRGDY